jgi:REP element-mobilizing transposase RayT
MTKLYDNIYGWFDIMHAKRGIKISAYVIMPNHMHFVLFVPDTVKSINQIISNGKRFMAYEIIKRLKVKKKNNILSELKAEVSDKDMKRKKIHKVFEISSDLKALTSKKLIAQKINYIHGNPVRKKWNLVEDYRKYEYSSAGFYDGDEDYRGYPVTHYLEVID